MLPTASIVLATVNAPYGAQLSAGQLAACISGLEASKATLGPVFSFFSEVAPQLQKAFIEEMNLPYDKVQAVAKNLQASCPYKLALAA
ncbi:hypothetical protein [Pararhodobacter oceanensis]|uniref:Uncharacterized protein n=1 Tax=Pararhodobacter oceanensis TaxID=2172121 RepID=A0A2T8HUD0_9RHOB|nr:hypothetical protein [Pararhodobacter oceanensis]PVH29013.1 hypothetical protein DDE20_08240 [Pararhodobacter oceanensis]